MRETERKVLPAWPGHQVRRLALLAVAALAVVVAVMTFRELELAQYLNRPAVEGLMAGLGPWAPIGFIGLFVMVVLGSLPSSVMTLVGGALFGFWGGLALNLIGALGGAVAAFGIARRWGRHRLEKRLHPRLLALSAQMAENGFFCMFFLRFAGVFPFAAVNYTAGVSRVKMRDYVGGTLLGMLPGMAVYTYLGMSLKEFQAGPIVAGTLGLAVLSLAGWWWQRRRRARPGAVTFVPGESSPPARVPLPRGTSDGSR